MASYDLTVTMAAEAGQLQLEAFESIIARASRRALPDDPAIRNPYLHLNLLACRIGEFEGVGRVAADLSQPQLQPLCNCCSRIELLYTCLSGGQRGRRAVRR
ncbi:hypothetical protein [Rhodococcus rhodochrous]|uniref:hypothetical protein n=1 Tax=Rhodococcus rhodochrous TaxID=1829 RepID=UPI0032DEBEB3